MAKLLVQSKIIDSIKKKETHSENGEPRQENAFQMQRSEKTHTHTTDPL